MLLAFCWVCLYRYVLLGLDLVVLVVSRSVQVWPVPAGTGRNRSRSGSFIPVHLQRALRRIRESSSEDVPVETDPDLDLSYRYIFKDLYDEFENLRYTTS
jgi:hypothetical protein